MLNHSRKPGNKRTFIAANLGVRLITASALVFFFFQAGCSKKSKAVFSPPTSSRVAFFPLNVPENQKELQWVALATPVLLAQVCEKAPDLEVVPFWESMPVALEWAGASRIFNDASAESAVGWLSAQWGTVGDIAQAPRDRVKIAIDFIPLGGKQIPFRYMNTAKINLIGDGFPIAVTEFLRYLGVRRLENRRNVSAPNLPSTKTLAEVLDREYGWFVKAEPGKAGKTVTELLKTNENLAHFLFSPDVYPQLKAN